MQESDRRAANEHVKQALGGQKFLSNQVGSYPDDGENQLYYSLRCFGLGTVDVCSDEPFFPLPSGKLRFGLHDFFMVYGLHQCSDF